MKFHLDDNIKNFINGDFYSAFGYEANICRSFSFPNKFNDCYIKNTVVDDNSIKSEVVDVKHSSFILLSFFWSLKNKKKLKDAFIFNLERFECSYKKEDDDICNIEIKINEDLKGDIYINKNNVGFIELSYEYSVPYKKPKSDEFDLQHCSIGIHSLGIGEKNAKLNERYNLVRLPNSEFLCADKMIPFFNNKPNKCRSFYKYKNIDITRLLEAALQPCGFFSECMGNSLEFEEPLMFRNLDGNMKILDDFFDGGDFVFDITLKNRSKFAKTIILEYDVDGFLNDKKIISLNTSFGYFSKKSLEKQAGVHSTHDNFNIKKYKPVPLCINSEIVDEILYMDENKVYGRSIVNPDMKYFKFHFFTDPVMPGSLGIQGFYNLLECLCINKHLAKKIIPIGNCNWKYRGQILMKHSIVEYSINIKSFDAKNNIVTSDAFLYVDGKPVYNATEMQAKLIF